ncbi:hypothetical protein [Rickettsiella endosymbiont of Miltochrista miniata]|uniref:hypothetical protein n=1 Tax=Rickettsiella endosymbiont of Miltochrista miniata TaxID=3066239 RepID=UPI00313E89A4
MKTINPIIETNSKDFFQSTLDTLLKDESLKGKTESQLSTILEYITNNIRVHTLSEDTLEKLISLHSKFLSALCPENFDSSNTNQTTPNSPEFIKFSKALHDLETFYNPLDNINQTRLKESCETTLNIEARTPFNLASKMAAAAGHGAVAGTSHAVTAIALESAKSKGYTQTQRRLLTAGSAVFNSLVIASYASIVSAMENSHASDETRIEKMWQSFAMSLASSSSTYAIVSGINYFAKAIENKLVKGFLNALPLAGNVCLLAQDGNSLTETAAIIGTNVATAGLVTTAIQTGWNFFSKQRNAVQNTDIELGLRSNMAETTSSSSSTNETPFYNNGAISSNNAAPVYEKINEVCEDGYLIPNHPVINSAPALPDRNRDHYENQRFLVLNQGKGILVSDTCEDDTSNLTATSRLRF